MKRCLFVLLTFVLTATAAFAQRHESTAWPAGHKLAHHELQVVTVSQPGVREPCIVLSIDAQTLTCESPLDASRVVYPVSNVEALYERYHPFPVVKTIFITAGVGLVIAAAVVNPLVLIPLGICAEAVSDMPPNPYRPPPPRRYSMRERVVYQRPSAQPWS